MGGTLLDLILTNKKELLRAVMVRGSSLSCSEYEVVEVRILKGGSKAKSKITTLTFRRTDLGLFRMCLEGYCGIWSWREEGTRRAG